jgi:class 3 adenylate cyclase/acyl-coenzyme A thioesterase PaaI-like protein
MPPIETWEQKDGLTAVRMMTDRASPYQELLGTQVAEVDEGRIVGTVPASEGFCRFSRHVAPGIVASITQYYRWAVTLSCRRPGDSFAGLDQYMRFYQPVPANGQLLRAEATARRVGRDDGDLSEATVTIYDASGGAVATGYTTGAYIDSSKLQKRPRPEAKRILATLLFTDIVGSTEHAERLGDARWRALLDQYRASVRTEIARCEGIEIDTAGDGFFVRFESPARALQCARAARDAVKRLGVEIRAGIHTGECEVQGRNLTGIAVHIAARVQAAAAPGEVLVSETVKAIATGSGVRFEDRGKHSLKGVPGEWRLYLVER